MKSNYLLESVDSLSLQKEIENIINSLNFNDQYKVLYDLDEVELSSALEEIDTYSFFSSKKIIVIKNIFNKSNDKDVKHLLKYIDNYNSDNLLIMTAEKIDNRLALSKELKKNNNVCYKKIEIDPYQYIRNKLNGYKINNTTVSLLVDKCRGDITKIDTECEKLMVYKINELEITDLDISNLVVKKLGESNEIFYSLVNYIISKNKKKAFTTYKELLEYNVDSNSIIGLMASQMKLVAQIKVLKDENKTNQEILSILNLKSIYQVKKLSEYIYDYSYEEIANFINLLADTDYKIKSGKIDSSNAIELLIVSL